MGMTIEEHIGVIEDLKSAMSACMPEPEKTEICTSLSVAIVIMRKYQKIAEIYQWAKDRSYLVEADDIMDKLKEVVKDGNDD